MNLDFCLQCDLVLELVLKLNLGEVGLLSYILFFLVFYMLNFKYFFVDGFVDVLVVEVKIKCR